MITLAVLGVLLAVAAPSFLTMTLTQRIKTASFDVVASFSYARSEAIKQNGSVTITPTGGNWANGWVISGPDGTALRTQASFQDLTITGPTNVVYGRSGRSTSGGGTIHIDDTRSASSTATARCITIDVTGIPRAKPC